MAEVESGFARIWYEFVDPADPDQVFRCDLTWLTSRWTCIFGQGCGGIYATAPDAGCCSLGAHFSEEADETRVAVAAAQLTDALWQNRSLALNDNGELERDRWVEVDDGERKTRLVDDVCIFHNDASHPGGAGCALHSLALEQGRSIIETKPDVCWQLPIRRTYRDVERADGSTYLEISIGEYDRDAWGPGGQDLDWYCTANTEAHIADQAVFVSSRDELVAMMGTAAYELLATAATEHIRSRSPLALHPASATAIADPGHNPTR